MDYTEGRETSCGTSLFLRSQKRNTNYPFWWSLMLLAKSSSGHMVFISGFLIAPLALRSSFHQTTQVSHLWKVLKNPIEFAEVIAARNAIDHGKIDADIYRRIKSMIVELLATVDPKGLFCSLSTSRVPENKSILADVLLMR